MSYTSKASVGDQALEELARKAGATGHFELLGATEVVHEHTSPDGTFTVEIWVEFEVKPYGFSKAVEILYLPGPLRAHLRELFRETVTIPLRTA